MYKHSCQQLACETGMVSRTVSAIEDFVNCLVDFTEDIDAFAKLLWSCLSKTTFQVLEDDSDGNEDAVSTPIIKCISVESKKELRKKLVFTAADIMSFKSGKCIDAVEFLRRWLDAKHAEYKEGKSQDDTDELPNTEEILEKLRPYEGYFKKNVLDESLKEVAVIVKKPVVVTGKNPLLVIKFFLRSRAGSEEHSFRSIAGFKASFIFAAATKSKDVERTMESFHLYAQGMNKEVYKDIIKQLTFVFNDEDWGACVTSTMEYECLLRDVLIQGGHASLVKMYALGQRTSAKFQNCKKEETVTRKAVTEDKKFKLRDAVKIKVPEILSIDKMLEIADDVSTDESMFVNTFVGLLDDRVKSILKELENERRVGDTEMYNQSRYKHNIVSTCKRRYCRRIIHMRLAGKRYNYALEHYDAVKKLGGGEKKYENKTVEKNKMLLKFDAYGVLKETRDRFTLRNIEDAEIRQSYQDFYNNVLCKHVDSIKNFYNEETWIITLAMEEILTVLDVYLGVTRLLRRIEKGKNRGQFVDNSEVIKIKGRQNRRFRNLDELRADFGTAAKREEAMLKMEYEEMTTEEILRDVISKLYNISTTRSTTKKELRILSSMLEAALDKL